MFKHTEVAERLGFSRQALDKHRKQLEQQLGKELGSIQSNARVYSTAELLQLREQLTESKQAGIDRIVGAIEISAPSAPIPTPNLSTKDFITSLKTADLPVTPTYKHVATSQEVQETESEIDALLNLSEQFNRNIFQELAAQALADGKQMGSTLAQLQIAAMEHEQQEQIKKYAKKQGLVEAQPEAS